MHKIIKRNNKLGKYVKKIIVIGALTLGILTINVDNRSPIVKANDYQQLVNSSIYLSDEEKDLLINDDLFLDIASANNSRLKDIILKIRLKNLKIVDYTEQDNNSLALLESDGYYYIVEPNVLHIKDYSNKTIESISDVTTHEFTHLLQLQSGYSYISEATAEIISNEYYGSEVDSYKQEIIRVKVLMEIIGSDSIWQYLEGKGNISLISSILNYLPFNETYNFLSLLSSAPNSVNTGYDRDSINKTIDYYLAKMYSNKYGVDISNDLLISAIYDGKEVNRTYFNTDRRTSSEYRTFAIKKEDATSYGYDIDNSSDKYNIVVVLDEYVIIEEKVSQFQLNLTQY